MHTNQTIDQAPHYEFLLQAEEIFKEAQGDNDAYMAGLLVSNIAQGFAELDNTGGGVDRLGQIFLAFMQENPDSGVREEVFSWFVENKKFTKQHEITDIWAQEEGQYKNQ